MTNKTKDTLLDIAAELVVAPLACYAYIHNKGKKFAESETGQKTMDAVQSAGKEVRAAAEKAKNSDIAKKAKEGLDNVMEKTASSVKEFSEKVGSKAGDILNKAEEAPEECADGTAADDETRETAETCVCFLVFVCVCLLLFYF